MLTEKAEKGYTIYNLIYFNLKAAVLLWRMSIEQTFSRDA